MLLSPPVLVLVLCGVLVTAVTAYAAIAGVRMALRWDPSDPSPGQLHREHRRLLIETVLKVVVVCELLSLVLFVAAAERMHSLFTGAMCAAGTLNASPLGYPTLVVRLAAFTLAALWLVTHRSSLASYGVGIIRFKELLLVLLLAAILTENVLQLGFFAQLEPDIVTSCCATIFSDSAGGAAASLAAVPAGASRALFAALLGATAATGSRSLVRGTGFGLFSCAAVLLGAAAGVAVIAWIAPSYYELPTHHCPFCLLGSEHVGAGILLYAGLLAGTVGGAGAGLVRALRSLDSPPSIPTGEERRLCLVSLVGFACFSFFAFWPTLTSEFRMGGS